MPLPFDEDPDSDSIDTVHEFYSAHDCDPAGSVNDAEEATFCVHEAAEAVETA
jgi:hypothetical protein